MRGRQNKYPNLAFDLAETVKDTLEADIFDKISKQGNRVTLCVFQSPSFEKKEEEPEEKVSDTKSAERDS